MSALVSNLHWMRLAARSATRSATASRGEDWAEDIEQDTLIAAWLMHQRGFGMNKQGYLRAARDSVRRYLGDLRHNGRAAYQEVGLDEAERLVTPARDPAGPLAMWRLQQLWPTLTDSQKAGVFSLIVDDGYGAAGDAARDFGVELSAIDSSRKRALERINNPSRFKRRAQVGVRELPPDERKAYQRANQKRFRERRRAAEASR